MNTPELHFLSDESRFTEIQNVQKLKNRQNFINEKIVFQV